MAGITVAMLAPLREKNSVASLKICKRDKILIIRKNGKDIQLIRLEGALQCSILPLSTHIDADSWTG